MTIRKLRMPTLRVPMFTFETLMELAERLEFHWIPRDRRGRFAKFKKAA